MIRQVLGCALVLGAPLVVIGHGAMAAVGDEVRDEARDEAHDDRTTEIRVNVTNPLAQARRSETIVLHIASLRRLMPSLDSAKTVIVDVDGVQLLSQLVDLDGDEVADDIVFQDDFAPRASKTFTVREGTRRKPVSDDYRVYGRFVRERHDDFAWENDRIAHRMYGRDLETWAREPLTSSGVDVWTKRVRKLVVNDWYLTDDYHHDHGEGADLYSVGKSRGCGGLGIFQADGLAVSRNFASSRVLANGPIRLVFELFYEPWDVGGARVSESKRVILDAGQRFDRFESTFSTDPKGTPLVVGIGIAKHTGSMAEFDPHAASLRSWERLKQSNGNLGCAIIAPGAAAEFKVTDTDYLLATAVPQSGTLAYFAGFGWDRSSDVADAVAWGRLVESKRREAMAPLQVLLSFVSPASASPTAPLPVDSAAATGTAARMAESVMARAPSVLTDKWEYDTGLVLKGIEQIARKHKNQAALAYIKRTIDGLVGQGGTIKGYRVDEYNIDQINMGRVLFRLWAAAEVGEKERYRKAIELLRSQMRTHPRTEDGAFWHKKIYPNQMWLDGVYMASPFLAEYAATFQEPALFDDIAKQIVLAEQHMRDTKTGLLYHGWDEQKRQRWADPTTGTSPQFWGRAMGWYAMAIVDVLDWLPKRHAQRPAVLGVLERLASAIASVQDRRTGVWWQVLDQPEHAGNYREASASSMFVYALSKAVRSGWLDKTIYGQVAARGYRGLVAGFVERRADGHLDLKDICKVAGLGGNPYRDGSYAYYTSTDVVKNDPKGVGAFLLAAFENE